MEYDYVERGGEFLALDHGAVVLRGEKAKASFQRETKAAEEALAETLAASKARRKLAKLTEEEAAALLSTAGIPLPENAPAPAAKKKAK